ncbi:DeoR family fructose operon transcriptional repressor [Mycetocola sp. CAN_C7]|uniref:DeoR/GlpR family DNA-binding transcription regulator n=1 Tax=Mycetocola sp. CAN_C7 TaxID=2787724 RepID=UPI0018C97817
MKMTATLSVEVRRKELTALLSDMGFLTYEHASELLEVHPMTIRRDLLVLESDGVARRVRGGVMFVGPEDFRQRQGRNLQAKRRIAQKLLPLMRESTSIAIDGSTTIFQFAEILRDVERLFVVTNGLAAFEEIKGRRGIRAFLSGGESEEQNVSLVGPIAVAAIQGFAYDTCFMSAMSLDIVGGSSESTVAEVEIKRAMAGASRKVVLAVDSTKVGAKAMVRALPLSSIDVIVTELDPDDPRLTELRAHAEVL